MMLDYFYSNQAAMLWEILVFVQFLTSECAPGYCKSLYAADIGLLLLLWNMLAYNLLLYSGGCGDL